MLRPMKISRQTPEQLILDETPWLSGLGLIVTILAGCYFGFVAAASEPFLGLIIGVIFGGAGLSFFTMSIRRIRVILDATTGRVTIRERSVFGYRTNDQSLADLSQAVVESTTVQTKRGLCDLHRPTLILVTEAGEQRIPMRGTYLEGPGASRAVGSINSWLAQVRAGAERGP